MRILVTGGSGFLGRTLSQGLSARHEVLAPSHAELDLLDPAKVRDFIAARKPDVVVHAAVKFGEGVLESTLRMQTSLLRSLDQVDRLLYFGSGAEFAKNRDLRKVREEQIGERIPADPYGLGKYVCNELARSGQRVLNLRLFGIYGPHEGYLKRFISNAIVKNLMGMDLLVRQDVCFDYLWVEDLLPVVERFLVGPLPFPDVNVTPTASITLSEIAALVNAHAERPSRVEVATPGMNFEYTGDNARLRAAIPGLRFTGCSEGITRLLELYRRELAVLDRAAVMRDEFGDSVRTRSSLTDS